MLDQQNRFGTDLARRLLAWLKLMLAGLGLMLVGASILQVAYDRWRLPRGAEFSAELFAGAGALLVMGLGLVVYSLVLALRPADGRTRKSRRVAWLARPGTSVSASASSPVPVPGPLDAIRGQSSPAR